MKLYIGNLSYSTTEDELHSLFSQVGTVQSTRLMTDRETGQSRGFAFVELADRSQGEAAINRFNGYEMNGRALKVNEAKPQTGRTQGGGGNGHNNWGGGGGRGRFNRF
ncbi:MAG: RNA-binding protein [Acidobacteriota bacterium]